MRDITKLTTAALLLLLAAAACQEAPPASARHAGSAAPTDAVLPTSTILATSGLPPSPSPEPAARCSTGNLTARFAGSQGAAAATFLTFRLSNQGAAACGLGGFVDLQMLDAAGKPLPTRVVRNGHLLVGQPPPSPFALLPASSGPAAAATFLVAYSRSPRQGEKECAEAYELLITPPGEDEHLNLPVQGWSLAPCNAGELDVSPLRPAAMTSR